MSRKPTFQSFIDYSTGLSLITLRLAILVMALISIGLLGLLSDPILNPDPEGSPVRFSLIITGVLTANSLFLGSSILARRISKMPADLPLSVKLEKYRSGVILQYVIFAIAGGAVAVGFFLTHFYLLPFFAVAIVTIMMVKRPTRTTILEQLDMEEAAADLALQVKE